eukprot:706306_1
MAAIYRESSMEKQWNEFKNNADLLYMIIEIDIKKIDGSPMLATSPDYLCVEQICKKEDAMLKLNAIKKEDFDIILSHFIRTCNCSQQCHNLIYFNLIKEFVEFGDKNYENYCQIFIDELTLKQPRYGVIKIANEDICKLVFVSWSPDSATVKSRMIYASIREPFAQALVGIHHKISAFDKSEMTDKVLFNQVGIKLN